jgi:ABC-type multidrug transport system ATPase subunit
LAKQGRTVISTIHQPSSEIFMEFDHIILMVDGHIIYDGNASKSIKYFSDIGLPVPRHTNPTDYYMKLMNKEGIMLSYIEQKKEYTDEQVKVEFEQRVDHLVNSFKKKKGEIVEKGDIVSHRLQNVEEKYESSWCTQFSTIFQRNWTNQFRQPLDVILKVFQSLFFGIICIILYY